MTILKIDHASIAIDSDHFMCIVIGGASIPFGKVEPHKITTMAHCDAMAQRQVSDARQPVHGCRARGERDVSGGEP